MCQALGFSLNAFNLVMVINRNEPLKKTRFHIAKEWRTFLASRLQEKNISRKKKKSIICHYPGMNKSRKYKKRRKKSSEVSNKLRDEIQFPGLMREYLVLLKYNRSGKY